MQSASKDYYEILGVDEDVSRLDLDRQYKRRAAKHHPDLGGSEETMKSLNEAYAVLKDEATRREYDRSRLQRTSRTNYVPVYSRPAQDVGLLGHGLSALLCLIAGMFLLLLVRFQGVWFLWPLAFLAVFVLGFGVLMARSAMKAATASLPVTSFLRRRAKIPEVAFWVLVAACVYLLVLVLNLTR
jgi:curved DNA-binding protein CbpA